MLKVFPVWYQSNRAPSWEPLPYEAVKELCKSVRFFGSSYQLSGASTKISLDCFAPRNVKQPNYMPNGRSNRPATGLTFLPTSSDLSLHGRYLVVRRYNEGTAR